MSTLADLQELMVACDTVCFEFDWTALTLLKRLRISNSRIMCKPEYPLGGLLALRRLKVVTMSNVTSSSSDTSTQLSHLTRKIRRVRPDIVFNR